MGQTFSWCFTVKHSIHANQIIDFIQELRVDRAIELNKASGKIVIYVPPFDGERLEAADDSMAAYQLAAGLRTALAI
jgi:hypothetical protein